MSTQFSILDRDTGEYIPVAFRNNYGGLRWQNDLAKLLPDNYPVIPVDNTAQGIETIGDIKREILERDLKIKVLAAKADYPYNLFAKIKATDFQSSSGPTEEFIAAYKEFTAFIKKFTKPYVKDIKFIKGHFYFSGFLTNNNNKVYYFNSGDVRSGYSFLIRTATDYEDYHGGTNHFIELDDKFKQNFIDYIRSDYDGR